MSKRVDDLYKQPTVSGEPEDEELVYRRILNETKSFTFYSPASVWNNTMVGPNFLTNTTFSQAKLTILSSTALSPRI